MKTPAQNPNPIDKDRVLKHLSGIVRELKDEKAREEYKKL